VLTAGLPTILDHAPTTLRHPLPRAGFEISAASAAGFRAALDALSLTEIFTPKIGGSATEGRRERLPGRLLRPACVPGTVAAVLQQAMVGVFGRVYELGPHSP